MKIHCIFEEIKDKLYVVAYTDTKRSILDILEKNWTDVLWLDEFFTNNNKHLQTEFWQGITIDEAIEITTEEADDLFLELKENNGENLDEIFKPLDDREFHFYDFQKLKVKGYEKKSWLRIYAIKYYDTYIITGGAIKLTRTMAESEHLRIELKRLEIVKTAIQYNNGESYFKYLNI